MSAQSHLIELFESVQSIPEDIRDCLLKIAQYGWTADQVRRAYSLVREHFGAKNTESSNGPIEFTVELPARTIEFSSPITPNVTGVGTASSHATLSGVGESPFGPKTSRIDEVQQTDPIQDSGSISFVSPASTVSCSDSVATPYLPQYPTQIWPELSSQDPLQQIGTWPPNWLPLQHEGVGLGLGIDQFSSYSPAHFSNPLNTNKTPTTLPVSAVDIPHVHVRKRPSTDINSPPFTPDRMGHKRPRTLGEAISSIPNVVHGPASQQIAPSRSRPSKQRRPTRAEISSPSPRTTQHSSFPTSTPTSYWTPRFSPPPHLQSSPIQQMPAYTSPPNQFPPSASSQDQFFHSGYLQKYPPSSS